MKDEYDRSLHIFLLSGGSAPPLLPPSALNSMADSGLYSSWLQPTVDTKCPHGDAVVGLETSVRSATSAAKNTALSNAQSNADFCSIDDWMAQWQMLAIHRPVLVQVCPDIDFEGAAYVIVSCSSIKMTVRSL